MGTQEQSPEAVDELLWDRAKGRAKLAGAYAVAAVVSLGGAIYAGTQAFEAVRTKTPVGFEAPAAIAGLSIACELGSRALSAAHHALVDAYQSGLEHFASKQE